MTDVRLRRLVESDARKIAKLIQPVKIRKWLSDKIPNPYTRQDAANWIQSIDETSSVVRGILYDEALSGVVSVDKEENNVGQLGYWLGVDYQRKGIMTRAAKLLLTNNSFEDLEKIIAHTYVFGPDANVGSNKVLEKLGFEYVGEKEGCLNALGRQVHTQRLYELQTPIPTYNI